MDLLKNLGLYQSFNIKLKLAGLDQFQASKIVQNHYKNSKIQIQQSLTISIKDLQIITTLITDD